jgi:hypothetical protein
MSKWKRASGMLGVLFLASGVGVGQTTVGRPMLTASIPPKAFGTQDYTITVVSALQFAGIQGIVDAATLSLGFLLCDIPFCGVYHYYTSLELPAGAIIDYIGVNSATPGDAALGFHLHVRDADNGLTTLLSSSLPGHAEFRTDYTALLGIEIPQNAGHAYVLDIEHPKTPQQSYVGYVEIHWRRTVSDPPTTATFADVPSSHPFFPFIEALASSGITGGCGGGNYCPERPLTRGQMAAFLAKALGLHWAQ